jgi:hypothetical protein
MAEKFDKHLYSPCGMEGECKLMDGYDEKIYLLQAQVINECKNFTDFNILDNKNYYHLLSDNSQFVIDFIDFTYKLDKLINDLSVVESLIPTYLLVKIKNVNEIEYINFQLEVLYHKIHTILEVLKLLVNHVYDLRLSEKECDWNKIRELKKKINPYAFDIIEKYYKSFSSIIHVRHLNTHRDYKVSPKSDKLSSLLFLKDRKEEISEILNEGVESYKNEKLEFVHQSISVAKFYVNIMKSIVIDDVYKFINKK